MYTCTDTTTLVRLCLAGGTPATRSPSRDLSLRRVIPLPSARRRQSACFPVAPGEGLGEARPWSVCVYAGARVRTIWICFCFYRDAFTYLRRCYILHNLTHTRDSFSERRHNSTGGQKGQVLETEE